MLDHDRPRAADPAGNADHRRHVLGVEGHATDRHELDAIELLEEIQVPKIAAELPISHRLQADRLLLLHRLADGAVFDLL